MKIYYTKHALTTGIEAIDVEKTIWDSDAYERKDTISCNAFFGKSNQKDWYKTRDAAIKRAETMRKNKLISIRKQKEKIINLEFAKQI